MTHFVILLLGVIGTSAASVAALITAIATLKKSNMNADKIQEVHVLVNSQLSNVLARVEQLTQALEASDTAVPDAPEGK